MATIEEKQKELDALQTDFDEYIVSARELEEELDAELTKCREYCTLCLYVHICRVSVRKNIYPCYYIIMLLNNVYTYKSYYNCNVDNLP